MLFISLMFPWGFTPLPGSITQSEHEVQMASLEAEKLQKWAPVSTWNCSTWDGMLQGWRMLKDVEGCWRLKMHENALMRIECPWKVRLRQCGAYFYEDWKNPPWKKPHSAHLRTLQGIVSTSSRPPFAELPPGTPSSVFRQVFRKGFRLPDNVAALGCTWQIVIWRSSWSLHCRLGIWTFWTYFHQVIIDHDRHDDMIDMGMSQNWSSNGPTHPHTLCKTKALEKEVVKIEVSAGFCTFSIHWIPSICVQFALLIPFWSHDAC